MLHGEQRDAFDLSFCIPAECADRLQDGRADIGIVPSIELPRQNLTITAETGISCRGAVRSILLVSKLPFSDVRTLAADGSSRTSAVLAQVVLSKCYGSHPLRIPQPPDLDAMLQRCDAALVIGDPALRIEPRDLPYRVLDLGESWMELTGLPMVFAVWAGHKAYDPAPFSASLRFGMEHIDEIITAEHSRRGIPEALAREYLTQHIRFEIGPAEREGLSWFLEYAAELHETEPRMVTA